MFREARLRRAMVDRMNSTCKTFAVAGQHDRPEARPFAEHLTETRL
jgi:hypothetical protein